MHANIEPILYGIAVWLAENVPTYLTKVNGDMASWPGSITFPAIFQPAGSVFNPPALKRVSVVSSIPSSGPFPFLMVNLDDFDVEWSGQNSEKITLKIMLVLALSESKNGKLLSALLRYADAIVQAVGSNVTLGGLVEEAKVISADKDELPAKGTGFLVVNMTARFEIICE